MLPLILLGSVSAASADPGDTTTVVSHHTQVMDWYEAYDSMTTFPDGSISYRRILMEFELGKYHCEGYDPTMPGEGSGGTGWCADWDYDVHVIAMTASGDTIELGEFITPYANSTFPATYGWDWKHPYLFDVTDYYPILKDDVTIRIFYAGYSGGFTGTVKFHFIEGDRSKDVVGITRLYHGSFPYGLASNPIEENVDEVSLSFPADADHGIFRTIISGHGGIPESNCSEFCKKWMKYFVNGDEVFNRYIWRDDCGSNWLAPQSGTWIYDRANWCPGNVIEPWIVPIPGSVTAGSTFNADINFQPFTTTYEGASYKMSTYAIFYGPHHHTLDAGIEDIKIPSSFIENRLSNPACGEAKFVVKNYGSETITSLKVGYQIGSGTMEEHTFTTEIEPDQTAELHIENFDALSSVSGEAVFKVQVLEVNGISDEEPLNDELTSAFVGVPVHTADYYYVELKTSGITGAGNSVKWEIIDVNTGDVLYSRNTTADSMVYKDTFRLYNGCYQLKVSTLAGYGLSFFSSIPHPGYVRLYNAQTADRISIPNNDLGGAYYEGNFGNGYNYYFTINSPNSVQEMKEEFFVVLYPNPATDQLNIDINAATLKNAKVTMINTLGQTVMEQNITEKKTSISTAHLSAGMYSVLIENNGAAKVEKVSIIK